MNLADDTATGHASWWLSVGRALHPARWALCLVGQLVSLGLAALALAVFTGAFQLGLWWPDPLEGLRRVGDARFGEGSGTVVWRCLLLGVPLAVFWSWIGGWIARHELVRRRRASWPDGDWEPDQLSATRFLRRKVRTLPAPIGFIVGFALFALFVTALAGLINRVLPFGIGAVLVTLGLPVFLTASLTAVVVLVGSLSFFLMPATTAAEGTDVFDALSRGYSYFYQCPYRYAGWEALSLTIAGLPLLGLAALFREEPNLVPREGKTVLEILTTGLSLSLFWTLQSLVYLKLRRVVDETSEQEIWMGSPTEPGLSSSSAVKGEVAAADQPTEGQDGANSAAAESPLEPLRPRGTPVRFRDTLGKSGRPSLDRLPTLLLGVLWTAAVLVGAALLTWQVAGPAGQDLTAAGVHVAVKTLADQQPGLLAGIALGVILVGALGLGSPLKWVARQAAVGIIYEASPSGPVRLFLPGRVWGPGMGGVLFATVGIELLLMAGALAALACQDQCLYTEVLGLSGAGAALLMLGSLGLGAEAASRGLEGRPGILAILLGNGAETLVSAAASVGLGCMRFGTLLGTLGLTWWLTCESISWWGGENIHWVRWGLDGNLVPPAEGGLYHVASWVTGVWFFLIVGCSLMYPIANALSWGAAAYLRAAQKAQDVPKILVSLSEEEQASLIERRQKEKDKKQRFRARLRKAKDRSAHVGKRVSQLSPVASPAGATDPEGSLPVIPPGAPLPP